MFFLATITFEGWLGIIGLSVPVVGGLGYWMRRVDNKLTEIDTKIDGMNAPELWKKVNELTAEIAVLKEQQKHSGGSCQT